MGKERGAVLSGLKRNDCATVKKRPPPSSFPWLAVGGWIHAVMAHFGDTSTRGRSVLRADHLRRDRPNPPRGWLQAAVQQDRHFVSHVSRWQRATNHNEEAAASQDTLRMDKEWAKLDRSRAAANLNFVRNLTSSDHKAEEA